MANNYNDVHAAFENYKKSDVISHSDDHLAHFRTKGSKNGISNTPGYKAIGELARGAIGKIKSARKVAQLQTHPRDFVNKVEGSYSFLNNKSTTINNAARSEAVKEKQQASRNKIDAKATADKNRQEYIDNIKAERAAAREEAIKNTKAMGLDNVRKGVGEAISDASKRLNDKYNDILNYGDEMDTCYNIGMSKEEYKKYSNLAAKEARGELTLDEQIEIKEAMKNIGKLVAEYETAYDKSIDLVNQIKKIGGEVLDAGAKEKDIYSFIGISDDDKSFLVDNINSLGAVSQKASRPDIYTLNRLNNLMEKFVNGLSKYKNKYIP